MEIVYIIFGLALGAGVMWFVLQAKSKNILDASENEKQHWQDRQEQQQTAYDQLRTELQSERGKVESLKEERGKWVASHEALSEKLREQKAELEQLQEKFTKEFELVANRVMRQNTEVFNEHSKKNMTEILDPLKEKLKDFEQKVETVHKENIRQNSTLTEQISGLKMLNEQMSKDALHLANALKGDSKTQGDWGEMQLEMILERSGLTKGVTYTTQSGMRDEEGNLKKPDFIINLPEDKHMVIDAKVSLSDYERYYQTEAPEEKERFLKGHIQSLRNHIRELGGKNYQALYQINTPDYVLMYVPIEPALTLAMQHDRQLFDEAFSKRILLVSSTTLMATMKTVAFIWKQENLTRNVMEISRQGGAMYDKFVSLLEDLSKIKSHLDKSLKAYEEVEKKITGRGGVMTRIEQLRSLGAKTTKERSIPQEFKINTADENNLIP
ncbi:MAG: DNA recombination protein RmuC [Flavobacteriales bacterium]|nr:DNA recombination protein RmuC [Flavobacteriales bacterium]